MKAVAQGSPAPATGCAALKTVSPPCRKWRTVFSSVIDTEDESYAEIVHYPALIRAAAGGIAWADG